MAKRIANKKGNGAGRNRETLPALASLTELPSFDELAASEAQRSAYAAAHAADAQLELGCVVRLDRGFPAVLTQDALFRAEFATSLTKSGFSRVAVGDWVCARRPYGHDMGLIEQILPRESDIARWKGGKRGEKQTLAANVDTVIVVCAVGAGELDADRVVRSAVIARDCHAKVAVVLTKADRVSDVELASDKALLAELLGEDTAIVATSSELGQGVDEVRALVPAGEVAIVLGESGAGKSTLLNALLGTDVLETGAVRASDDAGRHTTVARRMVSIPGAGVIVDEPGLRSLPMVGHERGLSLVFPDINAAARECRFRDCTHSHEPGCAVLLGMAEKRFSQTRAQAYLALAGQMRANATTLDPDIVI